MCYRRHSFALTENSNNAGDTENDIQPRAKYAFQSNRRSTDEYWIGLFVLIFIISIGSWHHHFKIKFNNSTTTDHSTKVLENATDYKIALHDSTTLNFSSQFDPHRWVFYMFTCNIRYMDALLKAKQGVFLIWVNVAYCINLIAFSLSLMRLDYVFCKQMNKICDISIIFFLEYRCCMFLAVNLSDVPVYFDYKIAFWLLPEAIFTLISVTTKLLEENDVDSHNGDFDKIIYLEFKKYGSEMQVTLMIILKTLILITWCSVCDLHWDNPLLYAIAGGSCYVGLTFYHYGLMVIACATSISLDCQKPLRSCAFRALCIIGRYHFGTACYRATLIFPRLKAAFVMNETEFRKMPHFSTISTAKRLYVTYCEIYNVSPIVTAAIGRSYSESMRELLRGRYSKTPFQSFTKVGTNFSPLVVGTNSLMLTLLWSQGAIIDPRFSVGTWVMIVKVTFEVYMFIRASDAVLGTIWFQFEEDEANEEEHHEHTL